MTDLRERIALLRILGTLTPVGSGSRCLDDRKRRKGSRPVFDWLENRALLSIASQYSYVDGYSTVEDSASNPAVNAVTPVYAHQINQSAPNITPITDGSSNTATSPTPGATAGYSLSLKSQVSAPGSDSGQVTISGSLNTSRSTYYQDSYFGGTYQVAGTASQAGTLTVNYNAGPSLAGNAVVANFYDGTYHTISGSYTYILKSGDKYSFLVTYSVEHVDPGGGFKSVTDSGVSVAASSSFTWELVPPHVSLAATIDSSLQGIHRLLYQGQSLAVPIIVTDTGNAAAAGNVNVNFYLSTNQQASVSSGDVLLTSDVNQALNIAAGKSGTITPHVTIPTTTKVGTYFIKAVISPGSKNTLSFTNGPIVAVSPALVEVDATQMFNGTSQIYENAVTQAKANPNFVPPSVKPYGFTDTGFQAYIKYNEGWENGPYLDSQKIPTIGWGFALEDKDSKGNLTNDALAIAQFNALDAEFKKSNNIGWVDPRTGTHLNFNGLLQLAVLNGSNTSKPLKYQIPEFTQTSASGWFTAEYTVHKDGVMNAWNNSGDTTVSFIALVPQVQLALIDMSYNIGYGYVDDFTNMVTFINSGGKNLAYAGFELMNSLYATQVPNRATMNFQLVVSGYESYL